MKSKIKTDWSAATRHLSRVDPKLAAIIKKVGPCTITARRDYYPFLCVCIFNQQISTKIAALLYGRFRNMFPRRKPDAKHLLALHQRDENWPKLCGVSRQKREYLLDLSRKFVEGKIPTRKFSRMSDEEVIESLTQIKGIGRWTAEMFLMFVLDRPDVLPVDDLGLREAVKRVYKLRERPDAKKLKALAEKWRPWRTVATWYMWRSMK